MIFFDIDGTLLDFKAAERGGMQAVYERYRTRSHTPPTNVTTPGAALGTSIAIAICRDTCPSPNNSENG